MGVCSVACVGPPQESMEPQASASMERRDVESTPAGGRKVAMLCAGLVATGFFGMLSALLQARSELQRMHDEKSSLKVKHSAALRERDKEVHASRQRTEQQHSATLRAREKELHVSRQRLDQLLQQINVLNASNATMANWYSVAQLQLQSYESSTQQLSAALRRAQGEARTMKQSLRDAERQRDAEKERKVKESSSSGAAAMVEGSSSSGAAAKVEEDSSSTPAGGLRYAALKVTWRGERGGTYRIIGESPTELVAALEDPSFSTAVASTPDVALTAWLPCRANDTYTVTVHLLSGATANRATIPGVVYLTDKFNFSQHPGAIMPGTRFTKIFKPSYTSAAPVPMGCDGSASCLILLGKMRCDGSVTVRSTELMHPASSSPYLIGGWRKQPTPFPSAPGLPRAVWVSGNLRQVAEELDAAWYGGKAFTRPASQRLPKRKSFKWKPHEPAMSTDGREKASYQWVDLLASTGRQGKLQQGLAGASRREARGKFWIHVAGDSIGSGLAAALMLFFAERSAREELGSGPKQTWKNYSALWNPLYSCKNWQRFEVEVGRVRISWIHWAQTRCLHGSSARPAAAQLIELGLWDCDRETQAGPSCAKERAAADPTSVDASCYSQCTSKPDVLLLQSGLWDVQDRPIDALPGEVDSLLRQLKSRHVPSTRLAWLGPLAVWRATGVHSWRTYHRLLEHAQTLVAPVLEKHGVALVNALQMFAALPRDQATGDGSHWHVDLYMDWMNVILNELRILA